MYSYYKEAQFSVPKITIFGLELRVKSGLEKSNVKSLHAVIFITEIVILGTFMK